MSLRSVIIGLLLGLSVAGFTYFNDQVIRQTFFVGNHLPIAVFGFLLVIILLATPVLRRLRPTWVLRPLEIGIIAALGLAACGWPGGSFMRLFTTTVALPGHYYTSKADWRANHVLSYVPGGSAMLADGQVRDWAQLAKGVAAGSADTSGATLAGRLWSTMGSDGRMVVQQVAQAGIATELERGRIVDAINRCLAEPELLADNAQGDSVSSAAHVERRNRAAIEQALPGVLLSPPSGRGVLLEGGRGDAPAVVNLMQGWQGSRKPGLADLPWDAWLPVLLLWGSLALLIGIAAVCIVYIVQPQWKRELLPYPIARFIQDVAEPSADGATPKVVSSKLFWWGLGTMVVLHLVNGLQVWFPDSIRIPLEVDAMGLRQLFPGAEIPHFLIAGPALWPTVAAFTFFLNTQVAFSVGISGYAYALVATLLVSNGISVDNGNGNFALMRFGGYLGAAMIVLYLGRRYYLSVLAAAVGMPRSAEVPSTVPWALRLLMLCVGLSTIVLTTVSLDWQLGLLAILLVLMMMLVMTRISAETGVFFMQVSWLPVMILTAVFGIEALGPTTYLLLFMVSGLFAGDMREAIMPFLANGMYAATERDKPVPAKGMFPAVTFMVAASLVVALVVTILFQYRTGYPFADSFASGYGARPFDELSRQITSMSAFGDLGASMVHEGFGRFAAMRPKLGDVGWIVAGVGLVIGCSMMRTRFTWWPLHPVLFLVWGTYVPSDRFGISILIGWFMKVLVVKFAGAKGYHTAKALMIGVIAGEILAALGWIVVGLVFYAVTGTVPKTYSVFVP